MRMGTTGSAIRRIGLAAGLAALSAVGGAADAELLTSALEIRSLSAEEAEEARPVRITAQVIFADPPATVFVQDETAGTFFRLQSRTSPEPGDRLEITGVTFPGLYLPGIEEARFTFVSRQPLPPGIPVDFEDLRNGRFHYQRVRVEGIVRSIEADEEGTGIARLAMNSRILEIRVGAPPDGGPGLVDSRVAVTGLAAGLINDRRQLVQPYLRSMNWSEFEILAPAPPKSRIPTLSPSSLFTFHPEERPGHRVRMTGRVLAHFDGRDLFLENEESSVLVRLQEARPPLAPGTEVEVIGFPEMAGLRARIGDAILTSKAPPSTTPEPVARALPELSDGELDGRLVRTRGQLVEQFPTGSGSILTLREDGQTLRVGAPFLAPDLRIGSTLRVDGICQVDRTSRAQYRVQTESVILRLRSRDDLLLVRAPPWWTPERLTRALVVFVAILGLALLWIVLLRRQVGRQTLALRDRIETEAVLEERQRIAREFHDTLEQDLAGLSLRLDAASSRSGDEKLSGFLEDSRHLVTRIQSETRNLVADLRATGSERGELRETFETIRSEHPSGLGPRIVLDLEELPPLPSRTAHHLRMITREAVTNAVKHADPSEIRIRTEHRDGKVRLTVTDDGSGFDPAVLERSNPGHFGCMGIRERATRIGARAEWRTAPGEGTSLLVTLPTP